MGLLRIAKVPALTIAPERTVLEAVQSMNGEQDAAVAVIEQGQLVGVFTARDALHRVLLARRDPVLTPVAEVMTRRPHVARRATSEREAFRTMIDNRIHHLPIVDTRGAVLGMVSLQHLLQLRVEDLSERLDAMADYVGADGPGG